MKYATLFLDLDGTLIDSYSGIEWAFHNSLARVLPRCPRVPLREMIGPLLPEIFSLYLQQNLGDELSESERESLIPGLLDVFREYYDAEGAVRCEPYPNVSSLLQRFHENGVRQILVTNKPSRPTLAILEHLQWREYFQAVFCPDSRHPEYPDKTQSARHALQQFQLVPREVLFVGDSADDALAAAQNDLDFAAVLYGYGAAREYSARYQLQNFSELTMLSGS